MKTGLIALAIASMTLSACAAPEGAGKISRNGSSEWSRSGGNFTVPYADLFDPGRSYPRPSATSRLRDVATDMLRDPSLRLAVIGHDHSDGRPQKSLVETEKRAVAIQAIIVSSGVDISRVRAFGAGDARPVATNRTPEGQAANRRIEFVFTKGE